MTSRSGCLSLLAAYPCGRSTFAALDEAGPRCEYILDSGAFTAWKSGKPIALNDYMAFLRDLPVKPAFYFNLDVIANPVESERHFLMMREQGFDPVPVFTRGMTEDDLGSLMARSEVVGIGGIVKGARSKVGPYLKALMQKADGHKVHLLGLTEETFIRYFKPYSCDSSSWTRAGMYGLLDVYMGQGTWERIYRGRLGEVRPPQVVMERLAHYGLDPYCLLQESNWRGSASKALLVAARSWIDAINDYRTRLNTRIYLVASTAGAIRFAAERFKEWESGTWPRIK
jgi:hypothetical protein